MKQLEALLKGEKKLGIIGMGYVGYSSMMRYLKKGVRCVVTDFDEVRLEQMRERKYPPRNRFLFWKDMEALDHAASERPFEIVSPEEVVRPDIEVFLVGVPLDYRATRTPSDLERTVGLLGGLKERREDRPVVIFECMFKPYTMERLIVPAFERHGVDTVRDVILAYAPRRDWFYEELGSDGDERLMAAVTADEAGEVRRILELVQENVVESDDVLAVEVAECLQNGISYLGNALINQLLFSYPDADIRESVRLIKGVNRRIDPGLNAGFELLLSSQFLIDAARNPKYLTTLTDALSSHFSVQQGVVELLKRHDVQRVAVLGLLSHENKAEYDSAPPLLLPSLLREQGLEVGVHDPFLTKKKIRALTGCSALDFPEGLREAEAVLLLTPHTGYALIGRETLLEHLTSCRLVVDNTGLWSRYGWSEEDGIDFRVVGERGSLL